uniref:Zinc finger, CCHC-type n=1 Tax=Tanacetum cinerariifolium TaxID=118510 RepID=A0A6L2JGZ8_TANCI|nr:zinc finger, CCHC-type [Tanacetum cinerariifolium]
MILDGDRKRCIFLTTLKVVYVLTTPMPELLKDDTVEAIRRRAKWKNDNYICIGHILNGMSDPLFDIYQNVKSRKELWDSLESKYMAEDASSKKFIVSNFNNYKMLDSSPVMKQFNELFRNLGQYTQHGLKMDESISVSCVIDKLPPSWEDFKHSLKHDESLRVQESDEGKGKEVAGPSVTLRWIAVVETKRITQMLMVRERGLRTNPKTKVDAIAWWIDSDATTHVCKARCWFNTYEPVEDGSVLYMGDDHFAPVHGKGSVVYESDKYILSKSDVFVEFSYCNNGMFMLNLNKVPDDFGSVYMSSSTVANSSLWHARLGHVHYKRMLEMSKDDLIPAIDENPKKCTTSPYTPQQNGVAEKKNKALKEMVNSMLSYSGLSEGFRGEAMLTTCYLLNMVWGCRAVVRLPDPTRKTLGEKGIDCIFVGYAKHSKAYSIEEDPRTHNKAMQSRDATFWKEAIDDEIGYIMENNTWVLSDLPTSCKPLGCKWILKRKMKVDGTIDKFKARLVIQGFRKIEGTDYFDTYAAVARITTIRLLLALAAIHNLVIHQMDVKTTFLNGDLEKEVYMKQPKGFVMPGNEHKVCKLVKSLYGIKQEPKQWHQKFDEVMFVTPPKWVTTKYDVPGALLHNITAEDTRERPLNVSFEN